MSRISHLGRTQPRRGAIAVFVAVCLVALLGVVAIATDGGVLLAESRHAQATADACALAAASVLYQYYPTQNGTGPVATAQQAGYDIATANGYVQSGPGANATVTINVPPQSGIYQGKAGYAEAIVSFNQPRSFSNIFGKGALPVTARAVARGAWINPNAGVLVLNYSGKGDLSDKGNGSFAETGGPVIVNSNNAAALVTVGNGSLLAQSVDVTGGISTSGGGTIATVPVPNQIFTGVHPTPDPLAYLPQPSIPPAGTMTVTNLGQGNKQYVLTPGSYSNLPNFSQGDVVILEQASYSGTNLADPNRGLYYINGGGLTSTGANITMDPNTSGGVLIYNAPQSNANNQGINITGNPSGTVNLSPLTTGPYAGMVFWEDRNSSAPIQINGNGSFAVRGTFYAAGAQLSMAGNGGTYVGDDGLTYQGSLIGSQYISLDLTMTGNGNIKINYVGPQVARTRIVTLVE